MQCAFADYLNEDDGAINYYVSCPTDWRQEDKDRAFNHFNSLNLASRYRLEAGKHLSEVIDQKNAFEKMLRRLVPAANPEMIKSGFFESILQPIIYSGQFDNHWKKVMYQWHRWMPPPPEIRFLRALLRRRDVLVSDVVREQNRMEKYQSTDTPAGVVSSSERMLHQLRLEVKDTEKLISHHIRENPGLKRDYDLLTSIKSVGPQLGTHMLVVLRSHDFTSADQAASFLGVVPVEKQSGTSVRSQARMSKIGPPQLRARLYLSALCGKTHNPRMRNIYDQLCLRGKPKMVAIGALMRKLAHWCYGVLNSGREFSLTG